MTSFKEWCAEKYGISEIVEGKIRDCTFVPTNFPPSFGTPKTLTPQDGSIYKHIRKKLLGFQPPINIPKGTPIPGFIIDSRQAHSISHYPNTFEYREPAPIYFMMKPHEKAKLNHFTQQEGFIPRESFNPLTGQNGFLMYPRHLDRLYSEYTAEMKSKQKKEPLTLEELDAWEKDVTSLIDILKQNKQLKSYLSKSHHLAKDYSNDETVDNEIFQACSGYSLSLQIYAQQNRELLSKEEYNALQHAIDILGRGVEQGLKTDANFIHYLDSNLGRRTVGHQPPDEWIANSYYNPIRNRSIGATLEKTIQENIDSLLYGNPHVVWGRNKKPYKMRRFLPDAHMQSETNEITLQGGRMINHSAMLRIIKVGVDRNGRRSDDPAKIHHFDYYHVQTNLGAECNEAEWQYNTCLGTYVTKLGPTTLQHDQIVPLSLDPYSNPVAYQQCMENTLRELIKTERHMTFYRKPQVGPNGEGSSPPGSPEAIEWTRLNNRLSLLKGTPVFVPVPYTSIGLDGAPVDSVIKNKRNYIQEGGSCCIFSIKQLVASILGNNDTSRHSHFLQQNDGKKHIEILEQLKREINSRKSNLQHFNALEQHDDFINHDSSEAEHTSGKEPIMPTKLSYNDYYSQQMQFIDRFIRNDKSHPSDAARLQRIAQLEKQQRIFFMDEFLNIEPGKELETTRIGYKPLDSANYSPQQLALAPDAAVIKQENRRLSRYRLVYGPVDFYLGSQLDKPIEIPVITACAPNMMGTSQVDLNDFSTGGESNRQLKVKEYERECKKLADFIVSQAKQSGQERLIMPAFGVGVYIQKLDHPSKELARKAMYQAFADAAIKHQMPIDWIVWKGDKDPDGVVQKLRTYAPGNQLMRPVIHDDMLLHAQECKEQKKEKVVLLNPGSDRTVGGAYTHRNPKTLEEQIAQQSDLVLLHTELNKPMVNSFYTEFKQRKIGHNASSSIQHTTQFDFSALAKQINGYLNITDTTWISKDKDNYKISFKDIHAAQKFSRILAANNILSRNGTPKTVQAHNGYHVIYLTEHQLKEIPSLDVTKKLEKQEETLTTPPEFKAAAKYIHQQLGIKEAPFISQKNENYKISFKTAEAASSFRDCLTSNGIMGGKGAPKTVQTESNENHTYHVIYLTPQQWQQITTLKKQVNKEQEDTTQDVVSDTIREKAKQERLDKSLKQINTILNQLESKIGGVNQHQFVHAYDVAGILLNALKQARENYKIATLTAPSMIEELRIRDEFKQACKTAIDQAQPVLARDLGWGDYLSNLFKMLANAVIWTVTFGQVNSFFTLEKSTSSVAVEEADQELMSTKIGK